MSRKAKGWGFKLRGIEMFNAAEIGDTLSRKNPVAVVTLLPSDKSKDKVAFVVVHDSVNIKCHNAFGKRVGEYVFSGNTGHRINGAINYSEEGGYSTFLCRKVESINAVVECVRDIIQAQLPDKTEYSAAVNYPEL